MKNNKGIVGFVVVMYIAFGGAVAAALWHIPAWTKAKQNHTEAQYQAQKMFPQEQITKLAK